MRLRCRGLRAGRDGQWKWLTWLDPKDAPIVRHWRDKCMEPGYDSLHVGLFDDWDEAMARGKASLDVYNLSAV